MASIFTLPWADIGAGIKPADGALLNFYDTGTYNRRDTYTDSGAGTAHANPVVADANGVFPAIYLDGTYRVVLTDKNAVQYEEEDGIFSTAGSVAANTANIATNTANIATNTANIATNTAGILSIPISGLAPSSAADAAHDITISAGKATDSTGAYTLDLSAAMTKQIDNSWAAGSGFGGLFSGTVAADTTYHMFIIEKTSDGTIDAGFDTSITAANIPSGYAKYRRVFSFVTDSSADIAGFTATPTSGGGVIVDLSEPVAELSTITPSTTGASLALATPADIIVNATLGLNVVNTGSDFWFYVSALSQSNIAASQSNATIYGGASSSVNSCQTNVLTNTSSEIRYRANTAPTTSVDIFLKSWIDSRV